MKARSVVKPNSRSKPACVLPDYLAAQLDSRPEARALVQGDEQLTYGEIERESNSLARLLLELGCQPGDRIALVVRKSPRAVVAMYAAMKLRCAYVPIDAANPASRVARILRAAEPRAVLADDAARALLDELAQDGALTSSMPVVALVEKRLEGKEFASHAAAEEWTELDADPLPPTGRPDDVAHLLFTSGSTGVPKGVAITHANVTAFIEWAVGYFGISSADRLSGHPPLHFDLSTFDIYGAARAGAQLYLVDSSLSLVPKKLIDFIRANELTQWFSVPSVLTYIAGFDALEADSLPALRRLLWCGEVLPTPTLAHWMERVPEATFTNLYGPTEATIASSYFTVPEPPRDLTEAIPIGTACPGEELLVLGDHLEELPIDEIGDLYISGVGLSPGYWRDEELTRGAFIPDPRFETGDGRLYRTGDLARVDDRGVFHFVGRADSQIKSRGYRIELGEIEAAVNALDEVKDSAIVAISSDGFEGWAICCAYVADELTSARIRELLRPALPSYMLPSRWLAAPELPKNVNGKIDRPALREAFAKQDA